jgi:uncharacterized membrane protein YdjX (TVP38/TMEM64 family)
MRRCDIEERGGRRRSNLVWIKIGLLLLFMVAVYVLYRTGTFRFFMDRQKLLSFIDSLGPAGFLGFIALQTLQVVAAPIPGEVTGFIGGYLYGPVIGIFLSTAGLTAGSLAAFTVSRIFGRPFVEKFVKRQTMEKYDYLLHHKGAFLVFLLFLIPGTPKDLLCYILGLGHLSTKEFFIISTVGRFGGTVLLTLGGSYIHNHQYYRFFILLGIAIILVFLSMVYKEKLELVFRRWHLRARRDAEKKK